MKTITINDLYRVEGRAEIVNGQIVRLPLMGMMPGYASDEILFSLWQYVKATGVGQIGTSCVVFRVNLPHRLTISPNVGYYVGPDSDSPYFEAAPLFAVEVRCLEEYGAAADTERAEKRADYFAAGTQVVWDVDLLSRVVVRKYTPIAPNRPTFFRRGEIADAEPAVTGWTMPVDDLFVRRKGTEFPAADETDY